MKSLTDETREVKKPDSQTAVLELTRTAESTVGPPSLDDWSVRGYSSTFGGQLFRSLDVGVSTENRQDGSTYFLDVTFEIDVSSGGAGADYIFEYTVSDSNSTETASFFYQNGVYPSNIATGDKDDYTFRASAELERLSATFTDEQKATDPTDFSDTSRRGSSNDLVYVSESSPFTKHGGEPIPYFRGPDTLETPAQPFSSRRGTCVLVLHWNQKPNQDFPVARVTQGGNTYLEVRNEQGDIELQSDFASESLYRSPTHTGEILIAECRIDQNSVKGSVNREITDSAASTEGTFSSGVGKIQLDPDSIGANVKLFDVLLYSESVESSIDRLAKQLGYFYEADTTSPNIRTAGEGSPHIQNHLFFDQEIEECDMYAASSPVKRHDPDGTEVWSFPVDGLSVATDSRFAPAVGTSTNSNVYRLTPKGNPIWTFEGHSDTVEAVEAGIETFTYSASRDGTVKKLGPEGTPVWNFGEHSGPVRDIAVFGKMAVYSGGADDTVRRIVDSTGDQDWTFDGHLDTVLAVEVDENEHVYTSAANGEIRKLDNDGNEIYLQSPAQEILDLSVTSKYFYAISKEEVFKLDRADGETVWQKTIHENDSNKTPDLFAVETRPQGGVVIGENGESEIIILDGNGDVEGTFSSPGTVNDISIQPGTYEPHRT